MREKIAETAAKRIEHLLSEAQVIDYINNDEIVKHDDYLAIGNEALLSRAKYRTDGASMTPEEI